jgi:hypothetical protein
MGCDCETVQYTGPELQERERTATISARGSAEINSCFTARPDILADGANAGTTAPVSGFRRYTWQHRTSRVSSNSIGIWDLKR